MKFAYRLLPSLTEARRTGHVIWHSTKMLPIDTLKKRRGVYSIYCVHARATTIRVKFVRSKRGISITKRLKIGITATTIGWGINCMSHSALHPNLSLFRFLHCNEIGIREKSGITASRCSVKDKDLFCFHSLNVDNLILMYKNRGKNCRNRSSAIWSLVGLCVFFLVTVHICRSRKIVFNILLISHLQKSGCVYS